jgi:hypothetical protein
MKLKFRKNKTPIKIMEKGDQRPIIEKPEVVTPTLCPLCKKPLSENNYDTVVLNGKPILCHKTCP